VQRPTMRTRAIKRVCSLFLLGLHEDVEEAEASSHYGEYPREVVQKRIEGSVVHIDIKLGNEYIGLVFLGSYLSTPLTCEECVGLILLLNGVVAPKGLGEPLPK
jgi:hypothetical protein